VIEFVCNKCGKKISVHEKHAGKKGKCPKCRNVLIVPKLQNSSCSPEQSVPKDKQQGSKYTDYDLSLLDVPQKDGTSNEATDRYSGSEGAAEDSQELAEQSAIEEIEPVNGSKLPWIIDVFLYPTNASGIIHLMIFWFLLPLIGPFLLRATDIFILIPLAIGVYLIFLGYMVYYIGLCVFDSSKGGRRAPDITNLDRPGKGELVSGLFLMLGAIAICFWPVALYYVLTKRIDLVFWVLSACGVFFLPMALLASILFDATHALNPAFIVSSIFRTFLPYCGLVPLFCVLGGLLAVIASNIFGLPSAQSLQQGIGQIMLVLGRLFRVTLTYCGMAFIYLAMVAAHLLGRFYWRYKDKLGWGI
jgi:DNA-directed RNA polymerase subunit RPC12/RpoP